MQEKDFVSYEYKTKTVKADRQSRTVDMYEAFGWEVASTTPTMFTGVTLSFRRDRKQKHKQELTRLERQAEAMADTLDKLETAKTMGANIFAYIFGCIALLILGGGMCLTMLMGGSVAYMAAGIILGLIGIVLCCVNYIIYKKIAENKTKRLIPIIEDNEEKLSNILERGNDLLKTELI